MLWVTISRRWHQPTIFANMDDDGLEISVPLQDFIEATIKEMDLTTLENLTGTVVDRVGSVTWVLKDDTIKNRVTEAIKEVSGYIMSDERVRIAIGEAMSKALSGIKAESLKYRRTL